MRQLKITQSITNRESPSLERYLNDISKEPMISPQDEVELAQRIRKKDPIALEKLVKANLRFVVSVAKQYQNQGLTLPDLINEGNLGLIKAAQKFDETKGFKFISYAVWWIRQGILQALAEQSRIVRLPLNQVGNVNKIRKTFAELEQKFEREPTDEEIASELDISKEQLADTLRISNKAVSMDAPIDSEDSFSIGDLLENTNTPSTDNELMNESLKKDIDRSLNTLTPRESDIIKLFYGIGNSHQLTLDEIGDRMNLTRERVRQIKENALRRLKNKSRSGVLKNYLG
ncbi:MAG TPA: RNA polymerase sigma factor RpoD/SigA [Bacteroidia bacterium]|nr:RNA polymerase sigma factor RpoD/SigA [Bacteroidia bacterium]HNT79817.1 RNA polymerase sigma factor RpoD/SigA [Bacteroidia bacterium]